MKPRDLRAARAWIAAAGAAAALLPLAATGAPAATLPIDVAHSRAGFSVAHVLIERVMGSVPIVAASVEVGLDGATPTAVDATLDPARINTGDSDRDGDLTGSDWFDVKRFPLWSFKSDRVTTNADGSFAISGTLVVHGVGVPITLATTLVHGPPNPEYRATGTVERHAFGMTVTRTDALVGNDVRIDLDVRTK